MDPGLRRGDTGGSKTPSCKLHRLSRERESRCMAWVTACMSCFLSRAGHGAGQLQASFDTAKTIAEYKQTTTGH